MADDKDNPVGAGFPKRSRGEPPMIEATPFPEATSADSVAEGPAVTAEAGIGAAVPPEPHDTAPPEASPHRRAVPRALVPIFGFVALLVLAALGYEAYRDTHETTDAVGSDLSRLQTRVAGLESGGSKPAVSPEQFEALDRRVTALERRPTPQPVPAEAPAAPPVDLAPIEQRLTALERRAEPPSAAPQASGEAQPFDPSALEARLAEVEQAAKAADQRAAEAQSTAAGALEASSHPAATAPPPPAVDLGPLQGQIAALGQKLAATESEVGSLKTAPKPASVDPALTRRTALAVVLQAMNVAIDQGLPFAQEWQAAAALAGESQALAVLKDASARGVPTRTALRAAFAAVEPQMTTAAQPNVAAGAGLFDRLSAGAAQLVRVRPVGEPIGDGPPALIGRIDDAVTRDALTEALAVWDKLPEPVKAVSQSFADLARRRLAAQAAARGLLSETIATLAGGKDKP